MLIILDTRAVKSGVTEATGFPFSNSFPGLSLDTAAIVGAWVLIVDCEIWSQIKNLLQ